MFNKIAIVGVGLIGGSLGKAAKKRHLAKEVIGIGRRRSSIDKARRTGAIDKGTLNLRNGVKGADLVIIATPVGRVMEKIRESGALMKRGAIIIDVNSAKDPVVRYANKVVPQDINFVGCHPMAGMENTGVLYADDKLFEGTICIITPTRNTKDAALKRVRRFWMKLGAKVVLLTAKEHDSIVARISHLPHILAYSLCDAVPSRDMGMCGTGFKDTTRIAKSDPVMWEEIFLQNRACLLSAIAIFQRSLRSLSSDIRKNKKRRLINRLASIKQKREKIG